MRGAWASKPLKWYHAVCMWPRVSPDTQGWHATIKSIYTDRAAGWSWSPQPPPCCIISDPSSILWSTEGMDLSQCTTLRLQRLDWLKKGDRTLSFCSFNRVNPVPLWCQIYSCSLLSSTAPETALSHLSARLAACLQNKAMHRMVLCCKSPPLVLSRSRLPLLYM